METVKESRINFFATHEICLITCKALYYPFGSISSKKHTVVCGPLRGLWQAEELELLQESGWTVHYYASGELLETPSNLKLDGELALENGRSLLGEHTTVVEIDVLENDDLSFMKPKLRAEDELGIEMYWGFRAMSFNSESVAALFK